VCLEERGDRRLTLYLDHHCTFLNTCIGRRNYFSFFAFLFTAILACFLSIIFSILHIYYLTVPQDQTLPRGGFGQGKNFGQALKATPLSAVIFLLSIAVVLPVMVLFVYHVRLVCMNRTTVEQVSSSIAMDRCLLIIFNACQIRINATSTYSEKPNYEEDDAIPSGSKTCLSVGIPGRDPNPFAYRTIFRNVRTALLRPMTAHSWIDRYHYQKPDNRNVNPGHGHN
jgi:palmitoyltransferase ZDHHC9/14/18